MKNIISFFLFATFMFALSSCMKMNLEDLPEYEDALITSVSRVEYRYISEDVSPVSKQKIVKNVTLNHTAEVDKEAGTVNITVNVPAKFPKGELSNLSTTNLVVNVNLSAAARISPVGASPKFGVPGDWSKPNDYQVTAANGTTRNWKVHIIKFNK